MAVFLPPPSLTSFIYQFLGALYMGYKIQQAFESARQSFRSLGVANQRPWMDDNADGDSNKWDGMYAQALHWGYPWAFAGPEGGQLPFILDVGPKDYYVAGGQVLLWADLMEGPVPQQVTATIIPPSESYVPGQPLTGFRQVVLAREGASWRWSATASGIVRGGTHTIIFQAIYEEGRLSTPTVMRIASAAASRNWHLY